MTTPADAPLRERIELMHRLVREGGAIARTAYSPFGVGATPKADGDPVTDADLRIERHVRAEIARTFPDDGIVGEEGGGERPQPIRAEDFTWLVDPIDGTANFAAGIPYFAVVIGIAQAGRVVASAVFDPLHDELFSAQAGHEARLNEVTLRPRTIPLRQVGLGRSKHDPIDRHLRSIRALVHRDILVRDFHAGALMICHAAAGRLDGYFERCMLPWDAAPAMLVAERAGMIVSGYPLSDPAGTADAWVFRPGSDDLASVLSAIAET